MGRRSIRPSLIAFAWGCTSALCASNGPDFDSWASALGRNYESTAERIRAREAFNLNAELVTNLTASARVLSGSADAVRFVLNKFADLPPAEFAQTYRSGYKAAAPSPVYAEPTQFRREALSQNKVDWRTRNAVSKIYDQGTCGCCWAVSTIQAIESQWFIRGKGPLTSLSFQQVGTYEYSMM
jgi:hypothetical protein